MKRILALITSVFVTALGLTVLTAGPTFAHTPKVDDTCTGLKVELKNYQTHSGTDNWVKVTIDSQVVTDEEFDKDFFKTYDWSQAVDHAWTVQVKAWDDPNGSHGWSFKESGVQEACQPPPPDECPDIPGTQPPGTDCNPPPTTKNKHVRVKVKVRDECNCWRDSVRMIADRSKVKYGVVKLNKTTWKFTVIGRKIVGREGPSIQYMLPNKMRGNSGWAVKQVYKVKTTNKICPCHKRGDCKKLKHNHDTCPPGRRGGC